VELQSGRRARSVGETLTELVQRARRASAVLTVLTRCRADPVLLALATRTARAVLTLIARGDVLRAINLAEGLVMPVQQSLRALAVAVLITIVAATASAQQRVLLDWSGRVDSLARITIQGGGAHVTLVGNTDYGAGDLHVRNELPHRDGSVTVQVASGRGDVDVVQQPRADNDYTAIVRVRDHSGGIDHYRLTALWTPGSTTAEVAGEVEHPRRGDHVRDVGLLHWTGDVDKTVVVRWRGGRAMLQTAEGDVARNVRADVAGVGLPDRDVTLRIVQREGRGSVIVEQQPSSGNNYTAVIRVNDPQSGYGHYDFDVVFDRRP
jgi:hypothetical protein